MLLIILIVAFLIISYDFFVGINWNCLIGNHHWIYTGQRHGMVRSANGVIGTQRNMYACACCGKSKPIESKDYVD